MILGSVELPSHWSPMDGDEHVKLVQVQATSQEYKTVESTFMSTAQQTVNSIKKVIIIEILYTLCVFIFSTKITANMFKPEEHYAI